ncbi:MAG: FAD-binding oxidoreductase [Acidobacteriota bacterium]|nr:FAD-binding oxidoreductase [Acidobacteriota bacterium]
MTTTLSVRDVITATPRVRILRLDIAGTPFPFAAGQAVMAGLHGSLLRKPYSIASGPSEAARRGWIELLVQVDESGGPDPHLELARPGTALDLEGPFGSFALPSLGQEAAVLLVAGGTGIAPLRSMLVDALDRPFPPRISVAYSARSVDELAYRAELEALAAAGRIRLVMTVTREPHERWPGRRGRIGRALLADALPERDAWCLICGPPALVQDVRAGLGALGVSEQRIVVERYE